MILLPLLPEELGVQADATKIWFIQLQICTFLLIGFLIHFSLSLAIPALRRFCKGEYRRQKCWNCFSRRSGASSGTPLLLSDGGQALSQGPEDTMALLTPRHYSLVS